jgi:hypothetical protein
MLTAIHFHHDAGFDAGEVGEVRGDGMLAAEVCAQRVGAQGMSQRAFGIGGLTPQHARAGVDAGAGHSMSVTVMGDPFTRKLAQRAGGRSRLLPSAARAPSPAKGERGDRPRLAPPPAWRGRVGERARPTFSAESNTP